MRERHPGPGLRSGNRPGQPASWLEAEALPGWGSASVASTGGQGRVYVLALDESGTHYDAPVLLIAGLAVHEADVRAVERALHAVLVRHLGPLGLDPYRHELHAKELRTPSRGKPARPPYPRSRDSEWLAVPAGVRLGVLADTYEAIRTVTPADPLLPPRVFGAIVDRKHRRYGPAPKAEQYAYDHVLHRFDEMLTRISRAGGRPERGLVVHDRRVEHERRVQDWAALWQRTGARLDSLVQLPIFTDSRASRLVQAADFVSYALWRHYQTTSDPNHAKGLWDLVDTNGKGELSGVIHVTARHDKCPCPPCLSRHR